MGKKKKPWRLPEDDEDDEDRDEDEDESSPFGANSGDFFENFQDIFKKMMKQFKSKDFTDIFKQMGLPGPEGMNPDDAKKKEIKGPLVFGFSLKFDKNGKPIINKFGNVKPVQPVDEEGAPDQEAMPTVVREPIADIINEDNEIVVVVELPGVEKNDIKLKSTDYSIEISAFSQGVHKYQKRVDLPAKINPDHAKARYTNGILEVRLQKIGEKERKVSDIPID